MSIEEIVDTIEKEKDKYLYSASLDTLVDDYFVINYHIKEYTASLLKKFKDTDEKGSDEEEKSTK